MDAFLQAVVVAANSPSRAQLEALVKDLVETRKRVKSLQQLAIGCVLENRRRFMGQELTFFPGSNSSFAKIPKGIVDTLLSAVASDKEMDPFEKKYLQLQLLNGHVIEFDYEKVGVPDSDGIYFRHLLQNCPKIQSIKVTPGVWKNFDFLPRLYQEDILPLMASTWENLTFLSLETFSVPRGFFMKDELKACRQSIMKVICCSLPKLHGLEITLPFENLKIEDVEYLSKMLHLKILRLKFDSVPDHKDSILVAVHAAGRAPVLERFTVSANANNTKFYCWFIKQYAYLYPRKKLILEKHWLDMSQSSSWPSCLSVEELHVFGPNLHFNLRSLPASVHTLHCREIALRHVYSFVNILGARLVHLSVAMASTAGKKSVINMFTLLAACPKLQHMRVETRQSLDQRSISKLKPAHFKDFSYLEICNSNLDNKISNVYKKFFLGCQTMFKTYLVKDATEMRGIFWALQENLPTCLDQLEELQMESFSTLSYFKNEEIQVICLLMERSPYLKKVNFLNQKFCPPPWLKEVMVSVGIALVNTDRRTFSSDEEDEDSYDESDVDEMHLFDGPNFNSDGEPEFDTIQDYLMWKDSW